MVKQKGTTLGQSPRIVTEAIIRRMMEATDSPTQSRLAEVLGVGRAAVTDAKNRAHIPAEWILRLCRMHGLSPLWLETGVGPRVIASASDEPGLPEEFALVPMVRAVPRMGPDGLETDESIEGYYAFRQDWLLRRGSTRDMRLLRVAGDSMEPTLWDGDLALVDQSQNELIYGKLYVIGIDDGVVLKRIDRVPGRLVLVSDNRELYPPVEIALDGSANVRVVGRVVWMARELP